MISAFRVVQGVQTGSNSKRRSQFVSIPFFTCWGSPKLLSWVQFCALQIHPCKSYPARMDVRRSRQQSIETTRTCVIPQHQAQHHWGLTQVSFIPFSHLNYLQLSDWYAVAIKEVARTREGRALVRLHSSFPAALQNLYPDFQWELSRFNTIDVQLPSSPSRAVQLKLLNNIAQKLDINNVLSLSLSLSLFSLSLFSFFLSLFLFLLFISFFLCFLSLFPSLFSLSLSLFSLCFSLSLLLFFLLTISLQTFLVLGLVFSQPQRSCQTRRQSSSQALQVLAQRTQGVVSWCRLGWIQVLGDERQRIMGSTRKQTRIDGRHRETTGHSSGNFYDTVLYFILFL